MYLRILFFSIGLAYLTGCKKKIENKEKVFYYDFISGFDNWEGGFSDHGDTTSADYNLIFTRTLLPPNLLLSKNSLQIGGTNRSDDLFMFIKRKISGLQPSKNYHIFFEVEFASNVPVGLIGVGGAPDDVMMKVGATIVEPISIKAGNDYRMNIDKGNQNIEGKDMHNVGSIGVANNTVDYTLITRKNDRSFSVNTNANGEVWVIIGTDSGFESRTVLYYNKIKIKFLVQ